MRRLWLGLFLVLAACQSGPDTRDRNLEMVADDKELEAKLVYIIENDREMPDVRQRNIKVEVIKGAAILSGTVKTEQERRHLLKITNIHGIRQVVDKLTVKSGN
jgi:osmotically-inducible protein OsmY